MGASIEERNRVLGLVEAGQITAQQAAQLLDALVSEPEQRGVRAQNRVVRIWVTDLATRSRKVNMTATLPVNLIRVTLRMLAAVMPQLKDSRVEEILRSIESGATGRLMDLQDLEDGKRLEIFVEQ